MAVAPWRERIACALCRGGDLDVAIEFPHTPLANEFLSTAEVVALEKAGQKQDTFPLHLVLCASCGHLQMGPIVDSERMFSNYVYVTGTSPVTVKHFTDYAKTVHEQFLSDLKDPFIIEIGSNDGTMLKAFRDLGANKILGIDPAEKIGEIARAAGLPTMTAFFTEKLGHDIMTAEGVADLVVANNVFAHAEDILDIALGVKAVLAPEGVFVFEVAYLGDVIKEMAFDTIYHEHFSYHAIRPLAKMFDQIEMEIFDVQRNPEQLGRGSIRIFVCHRGRLSSSDGWSRMSGLIRQEVEWGLFSTPIYRHYRHHIRRAGEHLLSVLHKHEKRGDEMFGYGAPAKLTTLMYTLGIGRNVCSYIVEDSKWKQGLYTPGLHIPVVPPETTQPMSELEKPELSSQVCVIYAWNFADSIMAKWKGPRPKFIVPLPTHLET
jgi:SAM-dependent methyltransferase